ncbi:g11313 [Coccomyxa elongata]
MSQVPFEYCLFEPRDKDRALLDHQKLEAHLANYRRFMQYPHEHYSPLRFLGSFKVPRDCQDFLRAQLAPQDTRLTAAKALSHSFLKRMAKRRAEAVSAPPTPPPRRPDWWMLGRKQSMKFACFVEPASDADSDYDSVAVIHADCSARDYNIFPSMLG